MVRGNAAPGHGTEAAKPPDYKGCPLSDWHPGDMLQRKSEFRPPWVTIASVRLGATGNSEIRMPAPIESSPLPAGCYPFTGEVAARGLRMNRFCRSLMTPAVRERFKADPALAMAEAGLSEAEIAMVDARDWLGLVRYGVSPFLLFRLSGAVGDGLAATGARMRGETLEAFMRTRRVTGAR